MSRLRLEDFNLLVRLGTRARTVWRRIDAFVTRELALNILAAAVGVVVVSPLLGLGIPAIVAVVFLAPILREVVAQRAREWRRRRMIAVAAALAAEEESRARAFSSLGRRVANTLFGGDPAQAAVHTGTAVGSKAASVLAASTITLGGLAATEAATGQPKVFFDRTSFAITAVKFPSTVVAGGPRGDLEVFWAGTPKFPLKMVYAPDSCRPDVDCLTVAATFSTAAKPLVLSEAVFCFGVFTSLTRFDYSVDLEDANGVRTEKANADFSCRPS